ncbi:MAG: 2-succinyl-6-hydroxy-2,4-cyclohexadiene-1-carboxylate synthase [Gemmatimonadaceae bacterium]
MTATDLDVGEGLRLHVERAGDDGQPPLVLLHGFTGSGESWAELAAALRDRWSILTVDLPGHGRSSAPADPARYALPRLADDLARVLDELALDRVALLGYSMGGRAALHFALRHPARLRALVLESTSPGIEEPGARAARVAADESLAASIEREGLEPFVSRWEQLRLWDSQRTLPDAARDRLRAQRLAGSARGLAASLRGAGAGAESSVLDRLAAITAPVLLVAGALDEKYAALAQLMAAQLPWSRLEVVEAAGHAVHLERPAAFARLVADFLTGVA